MTIETYPAPESPGSLTEFAAARGVDTDLARELYSVELDAYRHRLAASLGITIEELHERVTVEHAPDSTLVVSGAKD